jgi:hypothetical protein
MVSLRLFKGYFMSLKITRRFGEGFILRTSNTGLFGKQNFVTLDLQHCVHNKAGRFYEVLVSSNTHITISDDEQLLLDISKGETKSVYFPASKPVYLCDKHEGNGCLDACIEFLSTDKKQVTVDINAHLDIQILRNELLGNAA